jgi:hypothetical protein
MENESFEERWEKVEQLLRERFGKTPDLEAILFLIGIQELGLVKKKFSKEQKQDLMHVAVCTLLKQEGYYAIEKKDKDGWPHFKNIKPLPVMNMEEQERLLKEQIIFYFEQ